MSFLLEVLVGSGFVRGLSANIFTARSLELGRVVHCSKPDLCEDSGVRLRFKEIWQIVQVRREVVCQKLCLV